jgi:hypothetical protein
MTTTETIRIRIACGSTKMPRKRWCVAWGAAGVHGCDREPNHRGNHHCPCGANWTTEQELKE